MLGGAAGAPAAENRACAGVELREGQDPSQPRAAQPRLPPHQVSGRGGARQSRNGKACGEWGGGFGWVGALGRAS